MATYCEIIDGIVANTSLWDGATAWSPAGTWVQSDTAQIGWSYDGSVFTPPTVIPPDALPFTPYLNNDGMVRFAAVAPVVVYENIRLASVTRVAKGRYRVYHDTPMPTDQYGVWPSVFDAAVKTVRVTARTVDYVEVRVTDQTNAAADATEVTVKVERVVTN